MCGSNHFICNCKDIDTYIQDGKCKQNIEGKVILPSGSFIPCNIPGKYLHDHLEKWHCRNPGQLAAGSLFHMVNPPSKTVDPADVNLTPSAHLQYSLSTTGQIAILEAEL